METNLFKIKEGDFPLIAVANHHSHEMRPELAKLSALDDASRFREEDPFTEIWAELCPNWLLTQRSRFEVDLNRTRETAFYLHPQDAWGLKLWKKTPTQEMIQTSLHYYDAYYAKLHELLTKIQNRFGRFVVLDLHSYNHRRDGPKSPAEDPQKNPEVNLGTGTMDRKRWAPLVDSFLSDLKNFDFLGRPLDVRENVKFVGRQLPQWVHQNFPHSGCALAIEFKKFFMDEWTGVPNWDQINSIGKALQSTFKGILHELNNDQKV